jgi:hypothetical protein
VKSRTKRFRGNVDVLADKMAISPRALFAAEAGIHPEHGDV